MGEANRRGTRDERIEQAQGSQTDSADQKKTTVISRLHSIASKVRKSFAFKLNQLIAKIDDVQLSCTRHVKAHSTAGTLITLTIFAVISYFLSSSELTELFSNDATFTRLKDLMLTIGGALLGVTAIAFSFVMFALQVNIERLPYGQFYKSSTDPKLLLAFTVTFLISLVIASASLVQDKSHAAIMALIMLWGCAAIFIVLLLSFKRALSLINPVTQLNLITQDTDKALQWWDKRYQRRKALYDNHLNNDKGESEHDWSRVFFLKQHPQFESSAITSLNHITGIAKRYWQSSDHEVAGLALNTLISINSSYICFKGKTFFASNPFIDTGESTNSFINASLEELKRMMAGAIIKGDEKQIIQIFRTYTSIITLYLEIDYSQDHVSKTHANIAVSYLKNDVTDVVKLQNPDLLMRASEELSKVVKVYIAHDALTDSTTLIDTIGNLAAVGSANQKLQPVTYSAMEELKNITLLLIGYKNDPAFVFEQLNTQVRIAAELFIRGVKETALSRNHSHYLGPYYGYDSFTSLQQQLVSITNILTHKDGLDDDSLVLLNNLVKWADSIVIRDRELFQLASKEQSSLFHSLVCWFDQVVTCLLALSNIPDCSDQTRERIQTICSRLVFIYSWVPENTDSIQQAENYQFEETLFELAMKAHSYSAAFIAYDIATVLTNWAFKATQCGRRWGTFHKAIAGATVIVFRSDDEKVRVKLIEEIKKMTLQTEVNEGEASDFILQLEAWSEGNGDGYRHSSIEMALQRNHTPELKAFLIEIKDVFLEAFQKKQAKPEE